MNVHNVRLFAGACLIGAGLTAVAVPTEVQAQTQPNILVIFGDDIGWFNASAYNSGLMGYQTPNIDSIGQQGARFTDWYAQQSCTAGRAAFITGQSPIRTGLTKVGLPGADVGLQAGDPTIAQLLKPLGYATGQFGKNHLGDLNKFLPTVHGFDEFFGNLYHLNAEEEPENVDYPKDPEFLSEVRPARRVAYLGHRHRRHDGRPAVGRGRQAADRKYRPAHDQAHGDGRRGVPWRGGQFHGNRAQRGQALLCLVQRDADAHLDPPERGVAGKDRSRHLPGRHGRV